MSDFIIDEMNIDVLRAKVLVMEVHLFYYFLILLLDIFLTFNSYVYEVNLTLLSSNHKQVKSHAL